MSQDGRRSVRLADDTYHELISFKADLEKAHGEEYSLSYALDILLSAARVTKLTDTLGWLLFEMRERDEGFDPYQYGRDLDDQLKNLDLLQKMRESLSKIR